MIEHTQIGHEYQSNSNAPQIGTDPTIRQGTIIYDDVEIGDGFQTGHHAVIREETEIGDNVLVGTHCVIDGYSTIGSNVSLQTGVYVPSRTHIGDNVFLGPHSVLTNDPYPVRTEEELTGPTIGDNVSVGANATILPGVTIGAGAFVGAGALVVDDVPPETLAVGLPATHEALPPELQGDNNL